MEGGRRRKRGRTTSLPWADQAAGRMTWRFAPRQKKLNCRLIVDDVHEPTQLVAYGKRSLTRMGASR